MVSLGSLWSARFSSPLPRNSPPSAYPCIQSRVFYQNVCIFSLNLPMDWNAQLFSRILLVITFWKCSIGLWRSMAPNRGYQDSCQEAHVDLKEFFWWNYRNPPAEIRAWATHPKQTDDTANARASRKQGSRGGCITSASMRKVFINETVY